MNSPSSGSIINTLRFAASQPGRAAVLVKKVLKRLTDGHGGSSPNDNRQWIERHSGSAAEFARSLDPDLWAEAELFGTELRERAAPIMAKVPFVMGGGGDYELLYFLVRHLRPTVVVETGVSAGWSSQAFLTALERNGGDGRLYSSDFPYFRAADPEKYIGILVDPALRHRWTLSIDGDEAAIPRIVASAKSIGLFHYDSDKSVSGRAFAVRHILPVLEGPLVMDDIADNGWFRDFAEGREFKVLGRLGIVFPPFERTEQPASRI